MACYTIPRYLTPAKERTEADHEKQPRKNTITTSSEESLST